jgi:tetratricopeptide (TPR) repeat protein
VIGEYLAYNFPQSAEGRQGARIALASWVKEYAASRAEDKSFEIDKVNRIAEFIAKTWPDQEEAGEASATLLNFAIQQRSTDKVIEYLNRIPADSPRRGDSELRAGQALWSNYLKAARLPEGERPSDQELERTKTKAAEILQNRVERMKELEQVSPTLVTAVLSLAQILVDTGQPDKAIGWLENETIGPLKLLNDGNEVVFSSGQMPIEIYKLALRAYVAVEPQRLEDAEKVMNALEKAVSESGDAKASETLTLIYIALGRELQQQLEELRTSKKRKQLKTVSDGFETFLSRIIGRDKGNTWSSLNWVAETFYSLGTGFDEGSSLALSPEAKRYYEQAIKAYQQILSRAASEPSFAPKPDALVGVRLRMAVCLRKIGRYDDAIKTIVSVLGERPMMLPAQILGTEIYQAKGGIDKDAYGLAILGGADRDKKGQPTIWGWAKLSKMTMNDEKFNDTFHLARIKLSECRYLYGMMIKDQDKKTEKDKRYRTIDAAKQDMWMTYKLYPTLGGESRAEEYNRLLKQIQRALGEKPIGLEEFRQRSIEANKAAAKEKSAT